MVYGFSILGVFRYQPGILTFFEMLQFFLLHSSTLGKLLTFFCYYINYMVPGPPGGPAHHRPRVQETVRRPPRHPRQGGDGGAVQGLLAGTAGQGDWAQEALTMQPPAPALPPAPATILSTDKPPPDAP